jgi:hypothetical protein
MRCYALVPETGLPLLMLDTCAGRMTIGPGRFDKCVARTAIAPLW